MSPSGGGGASCDGSTSASTDLGDSVPARPRPSLTGANPFDPGRRGVRALAVVAVVVLVVAAVLAWRARPRPEPVAAELAPPVGPAGRSTDSSPDGSGEASGTAAPASVDEIVVAVTGKVRRPGLVRLPPGSRVADAVTAAGGPLPGAELAFLNLARKVVDGELVLVGVTAPPGAPIDGAPAAGGGGPGAGAPGAGGPVAGPAAPVNLNTATLAQLDALPGVGPVLAQRIVDHRQRHGVFRTVADLRQVDGIGQTRFERLRELVTV